MKRYESQSPYKGFNSKKEGNIIMTTVVSQSPYKGFNS